MREPSCLHCALHTFEPDFWKCPFLKARLGGERIHARLSATEGMVGRHKCMHQQVHRLIWLLSIIHAQLQVGQGFLCQSLIKQVVWTADLFACHANLPFVRGASTLNGGSDTSCHLRRANQVSIQRDPLHRVLCVSTVDGYYRAKYCSCRPFALRLQMAFHAVIICSRLQALPGQSPGPCQFQDVQSMDGAIAGLSSSFFEQP